MKISIVGAGNVGGTAALRLSLLGLKDIVLVDAVPKFAQAKAADLNDARFVCNQNYRILGTDDINETKDSSIIVITAGLPRKPGMTREELVQKNSQIVTEVCHSLKSLSPEAIVIVVTNPLDAMTYLALKQTGFSKSRVFGMGLTLDRSRLANILAQELNLAITQINPCIIGSHGQSMLPLNSYTTVKGESLDKHLRPDEIDAVFQRTVNRGAEIVSLYGKGSAYCAPSAAIAELVEVVANNKKSILPVSAFLDGEYGISDVCIGVPCRLGVNGIEEIVQLGLTDKERADFLKSAESIKKQIATIDA